MTGNPEIDGQHQELFRIINVLHNSILTGNARDVMLMTLDDLTNYVDKHFRDEERLMLGEGYPDYAHHKALHDKLTADAMNVIAGYKSGKLNLSVTLSQFLGDWLSKHIEVEDLKMINFIKEK
jgi:hemerythrin